MDTVPEPALCANTPGSDNLPLPFKTVAAKEIVTKSTGRYYLIFGSFNTQEDASKMVDKYLKEGFQGAKVLCNDQKTYRVSLNDYPTQQEALDAKTKLGNGYKEAWITKY
jgi:septal ring-binding cell division protein DamX